MDQSEIQALYEKYAATLHRRAAYLLKNNEQAWEVIQDTFIQVLQNANSFRKESSPYTWLYRITTNLCLNIIQRHKVETKYQEGIKNPLLGKKGSAFENLDMQKFLKGLDDLSQKIFIHIYYDQMGQEETAMLLDVSRKTIYLRLAQIEEKLKEVFGGTHGNPSQ